MTKCSPSYWAGRRKHQPADNCTDSAGGLPPHLLKGKRSIPEKPPPDTWAAGESGELRLSSIRAGAAVCCASFWRTSAQLVITTLCSYRCSSCSLVKVFQRQACRLIPTLLEIQENPNAGLAWFICSWKQDGEVLHLLGLSPQRRNKELTFLSVTHPSSLMTLILQQEKKIKFLQQMLLLFNACSRLTTVLIIHLLLVLISLFTDLSLMHTHPRE